MYRVRNPKHNQLKLDGYKDLGWQNGWTVVYLDKDGKPTTDSNEIKSFTYLKDEHPEYAACRDEKHKLENYDNSYYCNRGTDNVVICHICKIYWHYDCSD